MPEGLPDVRGLRFLRTRRAPWRTEKEPFSTSQALAMSLKKDEYAHIIDLPGEDERVRRYLKGETLEVDDLTERKAKGWYLVCVDGFPLGWGKASNGTLKNKYLPGWRLWKMMRLDKYLAKMGVGTRQEVKNISDKE